MIRPPIKTFNTTGPCIPSEHYMLPVLPHQPKVEELIEDKYYFTLKAPSQSGKTTFLNFLTDKINSEGSYYALNCSLKSLRFDFDEDLAMTKLFSLINQALYLSTVTQIKEKSDSYNFFPTKNDTDIKISMLLSKLSEELDKDLIVFFDDADCLSGDGLISFSGQIRDAYLTRHKPGHKFPRSIVFAGEKMSEISDYFVQIRLKSDLTCSDSIGMASPSSLIKDDLTLANFTSDEIVRLFCQHTEASGQIFEPEVTERVWLWSEGQPWLVNALAFEAVNIILKKDYSKTITKEIIEQAADTLIQRRDTHVYSLSSQLKEFRANRVIDEVISDKSGYSKDHSVDHEILKSANRINQRAIPTEDGFIRNYSYPHKMELQSALTHRWVDVCKLDMASLLKEFQQDYLWNFHVIHDVYSYNDSFAHIFCFTYLLGVFKSVKEIRIREIGFFKGRIYLVAEYKQQLYPVQLAIKASNKFVDLRTKNCLKQLYSVMNRFLVKEGWLVIFDLNKKNNWQNENAFETTEYYGSTIHIVRS
jgi:hypothetical protein